MIDRKAFLDDFVTLKRRVQLTLALPLASLERSHQPVRISIRRHAVHRGRRAD
jgi:hypothetical protein